MALITNTTATINNTFRERSSFVWSKFRAAFQDMVDGFTAVETKYSKKTARAVFDPSGDTSMRGIGAHGWESISPTML